MAQSITRRGSRPSLRRSAFRVAVHGPVPGTRTADRQPQELIGTPRASSGIRSNPHPLSQAALSQGGIRAMTVRSPRASPERGSPMSDATSPHR